MRSLKERECFSFQDKRMSGNYETSRPYKQQNVTTLYHRNLLECSGSSDDLVPRCWKIVVRCGDVAEKMYAW